MPTTKKKSRKTTTTKKAAKKKSRVKKAAKKKVTKKGAKKKSGKKRAAAKKKATTRKTAKRSSKKKPAAKKKATAGRGKGRIRRTRKAAAKARTATLRVRPIARCSAQDDDAAFDGLFATDFVESSLPDDGLDALVSERPTHNGAEWSDCDPVDSGEALQAQRKGPWYCFPIRMCREFIALMRAR